MKQITPDNVVAFIREAQKQDRYNPEFTPGVSIMALIDEFAKSPSDAKEIALICRILSEDGKIQTRTGDEFNSTLRVLSTAYIGDLLPYFYVTNQSE